MTKKNPDDSVREEQFGANDFAAGTEDATVAQETPEQDSPNESVETENNQQMDVTEKEEKILAEVTPVPDEHDNPKAEEEHTFDDLELPQVDYSGYSKHELLDTLVLLIENRPPAEIRMISTGSEFCSIKS
ncbi:MAG: hypothetical protein IPJ37_16805 [Bacteroidales bacterium]|nr:hypothetical protein [Bacteroidales bacterium]